MSSKSLSRKSRLKPLIAALALAGAAALAAAPASAQRHSGGDHGHRGGGHGGGGHGGRDHRGGDRGWYDSHRYDHRRSDWGVTLNFGAPYYRYARPYTYGYYVPPRVTPYVYYNDYGLRPRECRIDYRFDYWRGRPADIQVRICADGYGQVYVVQGSQLFVRWR
jgi:hypothetical protein